MSDRFTGADTGETLSLDPELLDRPQGAASRGITLLVFHTDGLDARTLAEGQALTIGREAELSLRDASLSRQHARFELRGGAVWVADLGSTNGTRLNGEPIERSVVRPGDAVTLGAVSVALHHVPPRQDRRLQLDSHDMFVRDLDYEVIRARAYGRSLATALVQAADPQAAPLHAWVLQLREQLRDVDRLGCYGPNTVEILLPEIERAELEALLATIAGGEPELRCGAALYNSGGRSAEELIERSTAELRRTSSDRPWQLASSARRASRREESSSGPIAGSEPMRRVLSQAVQFGPARAPVVLLGETGTGKEVVARRIHAAGRPGKPLICINCGAIPEELVESTLFGTRAGAFTGAADRKGAFEEADGGTLLLDEIGELPPRQQVKLLRVLESGTVVRVGTTREIPVDVRVIAATHRDLARMTRDGEFREDLYYRLKTLELAIPPLRERLADIEPLTERFIREAAEANRRDVRAVDEQARALLARYDWPGNVRELRNVIERAVVVARGDTITAADLPDAIRRLGPPAPASGPADDTSSDAALLEIGGDIQHSDWLQRIETERLLQALQQCEWNQTEAAKQLRMPLRTLVFKIRRFKLKERADDDS